MQVDGHQAEDQVAMVEKLRDRILALEDRVKELEDDQSSSALRAQSYVLVDEDDEIRGWFAVSDDGSPEFRLCDEDGRVRAQIRVGGPEAELQLFGSDGEKRVRLHAESCDAGLQVVDESMDVSMWVEMDVAGDSHIGADDMIAGVVAVMGTGEDRSVSRPEVAPANQDRLDQSDSFLPDVEGPYADVVRSLYQTSLLDDWCTGSGCSVAALTRFLNAYYADSELAIAVLGASHGYSWSVTGFVGDPSDKSGTGLLLSLRNTARADIKNVFLGLYARLVDDRGYQYSPVDSSFRYLGDEGRFGSHADDIVEGSRLEGVLFFDTLKKGSTAFVRFVFADSIEVGDEYVDRRYDIVLE